MPDLFPSQQEYHCKFSLQCVAVMNYVDNLNILMQMPITTLLQFCSRNLRLLSPSPPLPFSLHKTLLLDWPPSIAGANNVHPSLSEEALYPQFLCRGRI
jgi:hypothetical protein